MSPIYWGNYVAHDNNRDAMALTLKLSQNVLNTYLGWKAQVLHDLHESVPFLYDNTIGDGPYNAWIDPLLTNEWHMFGWNNVNEMTRMGMPGVYASGTFDTWSPGYLMFMAATHNGISRLYETFGNGGSADTEERSSRQRDVAHLVPPEPAATARALVAAQQQQLPADRPAGLAQHIASNRVHFLRNFYEKSKRSILKANVEGPAAYVLPANDRVWRAGRIAARAAEAGASKSHARRPLSPSSPADPLAGAWAAAKRGPRRRSESGKSPKKRRRPWE